MDFFASKKESFVVGILLFLAVINLGVFFALFGFHLNSDTDSFIYAIDFFKGNDNSPIYPNRYLNPLYGVAGAALFFLDAAQSLIALNIIFYFGLVLLTYGLIRRVFQNRSIGFVSALIIMSAYPMLRYALTQVQDIGGYFWFVATLYAGWRFYEEKKTAWLHLAGIATAFGVLTKESGCMAALFVGIIIVFGQGSVREKLQRFFCFSWAPLFTILINGWRGRDVRYNSLQWFVDNWKVYAPDNYHFVKWLGVNITTYNIVWVFFFIFLIMVLRKKWTLDSTQKMYMLAVIPSSLSYFAWPLFISRTVFISAWCIVPLAAYSMIRLARSSRKLLIIFAVTAVMSPYLLQSVLRYVHLFPILDQCHYTMRCSWNFFWHERQKGGAPI